MYVILVRMPSDTYDAETTEHRWAYLHSATGRGRRDSATFDAVDTERNAVILHRE